MFIAVSMFVASCSLTLVAELCQRGERFRNLERRGGLCGSARRDGGDKNWTQSLMAVPAEKTKQNKNYPRTTKTLRVGEEDICWPGKRSDSKAYLIQFNKL